MPKHLVAPSLLAADVGDLDAIARLMTESQADWLHLDVMDGHFVPNITFGPMLVAAMRKRTPAFLDVHLMIAHPERYLQAFADAGADQLTIHLEACAHLHAVLSQVKKIGKKAGLALNPHTLVDAAAEVLHLVDTLVIMSVNPGFGGQAFIPQSLSKIERVAALKSQFRNLLIEVDGGIDQQSAPQALQAGADVLVAGTSIFSQPNPAEAIRLLKEIQA